MKISIIGTGYVGLVTCACYAHTGNHTICVDVNRERIEGLKQGRPPSYEPGLQKLVVTNQHEGRLRFTTDIAEALTTCGWASARITAPDSDSCLQGLVTEVRAFPRMCGR